MELPPTEQPQAELLGAPAGKRREEGPPHLEDAQPAAEALRIYRKMQQVDFNQQIRAPVTGRVIYITVKLLSAGSSGLLSPSTAGAGREQQSLPSKHNVGYTGKTKPA